MQKSRRTTISLSCISPIARNQSQKIPAFQVTGVDYAGPICIRNNKNEVVKAYICLFICATIRALHVHLEVVEDQTTSAFIRALKRFISRRGILEWIISDNAKTFKAGSQELKTLKTKVLESAAQQNFFANHGIKWRFIIPS